MTEEAEDRDLISFETVGTPKQEPEETNVYVLELKKVFDSCETDPLGLLDQKGLSQLCDQLNLSEHAPYITGQLLPHAGSKLNFTEFKRRFIQILPEIVEFSSATESPSRKKSKKSALLSANLASERSKIDNDHPSSIDNNLPAPIDSPVILGLKAANNRSDNDTSNDILSDFSEDHLVEKRDSIEIINQQQKIDNNGGITVNKLQQKLRELGLSDNGYLGRYELRLLCQHVDELKHLRAEISENEIFDLTDTNNDGRISLEEFCTAYNTIYQHRLTAESANQSRGFSSPPRFHEEGTNSSSESSDQGSSSGAQPGGVTYKITKKSGAIRGSNPPDLLLGPERRGKSTAISKSRSEDHGPPAINAQENLPPANLSRKNRTGSGRLRDFRSAYLYKSDTGQSLRKKGGNWRPRSSLGSQNSSHNRSDIGGAVVKKQSASSSSLCILSSLDTGNTGFVTFRSIVDYWDSMGVERSREILESIGYSDRNRSINLVELSEALHTHLSQAALSPESAVAVLCFRAELEYLRISLNDARGRADHYRNEANSLQKRQNVLVEEMDQSQASLELANKQKVSEMELKCREELRLAEERLKTEKQDLINHLTELEDLLHQKKQSESSVKNRIGALERESNRLKRDNQDLTQTVTELEDLNEDLRKELQSQTAVMSKKIFTQNTAEKKLAEAISDPKNQDFLWRHKAELAIAENKRLKDQIDELIESGARTGRKSQTTAGRFSPRGGGRKATRRGARRGSNMRGQTAGGSSKVSTGMIISGPDSVEKFKRVVAKHRGRKARAPGEESSEFESDPDPPGFRPKYKRTRKRKDRSVDLEKREERRKLHAAKIGAKMDRDSTDSDKTNESSVTPVLGRSLSGLQIRELQRQFSDERKQIEHQLKVEMAGTEDKWGDEKKQLLAQFEREKTRIRNQSEQELQMIMDSRRKELQEALRSQELELEAKFDGLKREMEVRWTSERNSMERAFAEEKMVMITQLQEDFDMELRKVKKGKGQEVREFVSPAGEHKRLEELKKEKQILEDSLDGQRHGFEAKMATVQKIHDKKVEELEKRIKELEHWVTPEDLPENLKTVFYRLEDEWREGQRDKLKQEREDMLQGLNHEREQLVATMELENDKMMKQHAAQMGDLEKKYQRQIEDLENGLKEARKRPITDSIEVQTADDLVQELDTKRRRIEELENHVTSLETEFQQKVSETRLAMENSRPKVGDLVDKMTQSESETGGRDPDSLIGNLRMELDLEKERYLDLEDEMKELKNRLGVVQRDSQRRMTETQERMDEAVRKATEHKERIPGVDSEGQTEEDFGAMLETAMDGARNSQEELIRIENELTASKQFGEEKEEQLHKLQERLTAVEVEYSNRLNDAHVKLEEAMVKSKQRVKDTVNSDSMTDTTNAEWEKLEHDLATCRVELSLAVNKMAELEQEKKLHIEEVHKKEAQIKSKELEVAGKIEESREEMDELKRELKKTKEERAHLNNAQVAAALKERDRLQAELLNAQQREVIYISQLEDAQISMKQMMNETENENLKNTDGKEAITAELAETKVALKAVQEELQRKTEEICAQEIDAQVRLRESQKECEQVKEEVERLMKKEEDLTKKLEEATSQLKNAEAEIERLKLFEDKLDNSQELGNSMEEIAELKLKEEELCGAVEDLKNKLKNARNEAEEIKSFSDEQKDQMRLMIEEKSRTESELWDKIGELNSEKNDLEIRLKNQGEEEVKKEVQQNLMMTERQSTLERHQGEVENLNADLKKTADEIKESRKIIEEQNDEIKSLKKKMQDQDTKLNEIEDLRAQLKALEWSKGELESSVENLRNENDALKLNLANVKQSEAELRVELESLKRGEAEQASTLANLQQSEAGLLLELEALKKIEHEQRSRLDSFQKASTSEEGLKNELSNLKNLDQEQKLEIQMLKAAEVDYKKLLNDAQNSLVKAADDIISMTNKEERLKNRLRESEEEKAEIEKERREVEEELSRVSGQMNEDLEPLRDALEMARAELEILKEQERIHRIEADRAKLDLIQRSEMAKRMTLTIDVETQSDFEETENLRNSISGSQNNQQNCGKCHLLEGRIAELEQTINLTSESGIEDVGSSPDYFNEDPTYIKQENEKLKSRLRVAQEKMLELRTCLVLTGSQQIRQECATRHFTPVQSLQRMRQPFFWDPDETGIDREELREIEKTLAGEVEKFREENFLLQARLDAKESLLQDTVEKYRTQLKETANLGALVQELYKENGELIGRLGPSLRGAERSAMIGQVDGETGADWSEAKEAMQELYVELGRRAK